MKEFVTQAWPILEPGTPFVDGIHMEAICSHLQAVTEGRIRNLIINVPPGHAKSLLTAVFWPAWTWIDHPEPRWLFSSYREVLATRDSVKCRRLIESDWYQRRWGDRYQMAADQNQKNRFENDRTGYRVVVPMPAGTGERGDYVVVDDPHSVDQAESDAVRTGTVDWWNGSMSTRLNDLSKGHKIVIQQRLHEADLTGDLVTRGGYDLLFLPAEFEPDRRCHTSIGWTDPRTGAGELLWPERIDNEVLDSLKTTLGSYRYAGQYQQRPAPAGGGMIKRHWWRYWQPRGANLPPVPVKMPDGTIELRKAVDLPGRFDTQLQTWDMAFKDTKNADFVVGQVHAAHGADRYLLDQVRDRLDFPGTLLAVRQLCARRPDAYLKLVEDKANGPAVVQSLHHEIAGIVAVNPEGGKISRATAACPQLESGNWYLPHPMLAPWVEGFIGECAAFPNGAHDDQCLESGSETSATHQDNITARPLRGSQLSPRRPRLDGITGQLPCGDLWSRGCPANNFLLQQVLIPPEIPALVRSWLADAPSLLHVQSGSHFWLRNWKQIRFCSMKAMPGRKPPAVKLPYIGTPGILRRAAQLDLIDLASILAKLIFRLRFR